MNSTRLLIMVLFVVYGTRRAGGTLPFLETLISKHLQKHRVPDAGVGGCDEIEHHDGVDVTAAQAVVAEPNNDDGGTEPVWIEYDENGDVVSVKTGDGKTASDAETPIVIEVDEQGNVVNVNAGRGHGWPETAARFVDGDDGKTVIGKMKNGGGLFLTMIKDEIRNKMNAIKSKWSFGKGSATEQPATADFVYDERKIDPAPVPPIRTAVYHYYTYYTPYQQQQPYYYGYGPQQWNRYAGLGPYQRSPAAHPNSPTAYPSSPAAYPSSPFTYPSNPSAYPSSPTAYPSSPVAYSNSPIAYPKSPAAYPRSPVTYPRSPAAQPIVVYSTVVDAPSPSVQQQRHRADVTTDDDWNRSAQNVQVANDVSTADFPSRGDVPFGGRQPENDTAKERRHIAAAADLSPTSTTAVPQTVPQAVATSEQPAPPPVVAVTDTVQSARR